MEYVILGEQLPTHSYGTAWPSYCIPAYLKVRLSTQEHFQWSFSTSWLHRDVFTKFTYAALKKKKSEIKLVAKVKSDVLSQFEHSI